MLSINHLITGYDNTTVLNDISLSVPEGQFFSLMGVNGAGKSSLIKSILDFIDIQSGTISINHKAHTDVTARYALSFLPERFMPPYFLTGMEFIDYMLSLYHTPFNKTQVTETALSLDLPPDALYKSVKTYSKGMAQKLGLLGCLLSDKKLLILDEPMSGLDPKARFLVKKALYALKERGTTLFYSSHFLADVEEMADQMAILHHGIIQFIGTPEECKQCFNANQLEQAFMNCLS